MKIDRDKLGVVTSLACTIHCVLLPLIVAFVPLAGLLLNAEWIHGAVFGIAVIPAVESLIFESYFEKRWPLVFSGVLGLLLMVFSLVAAHNLHDLFLVGGLILGAAHLYRLNVHTLSARFRSA
jgi:hypothetical protein